MEKKMVHELLRLLAHAASVYHDNMTLLEIVQGEDLPKGSQPRKEGRLEGAWVHHTHFREIEYL
jgi:hypothetical protein